MNPTTAATAASAEVSQRPRTTPALRGQREAQRLLDRAGVQINGHHPWDLQVKHPDTLMRVLAHGSLGLGDSYVDGWWDCERLDEFFTRILRAGLDGEAGWRARAWPWLRARLFNGQSLERSGQVAQIHYDLDVSLFERMLGRSMAYSCGYWAQARNLDEAQHDKLDLVCRKLGLAHGMSLLDVGCGWGSLMRHAAEHYGAKVTGLTISREQAQWATHRLKGLGAVVELVDYRRFNADGQRRFDRIASVGMFEHVGPKNHEAYFETLVRSLTPDGLVLLHTIGKNQAGTPPDAWVDRHIFPNGNLPSAGELASSLEHRFIIEDWHNFGADYDRTLMAWHERFDQAWPSLARHHDERFRRTWRYYLMSCAGTFRARSNQLWQLVLSPRGVVGGYRRVS
jgi:cyclopropane-fatty-acyl-phospholipid synthase